MFAIISDGKLLELCESPDFIKFDEETNSYTSVLGSDNATGILVNNEKYSIPQYCETEIYEGAPIAEIQYIGEGSKFLFNTHVKATRTEENVITVEDAIIDLNGTTQEDLDDLRGAIFDLANQIANSNQKQKE